MNDLPIHETIDCVCRKDRPAFWPFNAFIKVWSGSNRRPSILAIRSTFISSRFINKHKLVGRKINKLSYPDIPELSIPFSGALLCLLISPACKKKRVCNDANFCYSRDKYLFFIPSLSLKKALNRLNRDHHTIFIPNEIDHLVKISSASLFKVMNETLELATSD